MRTRRSLTTLLMMLSLLATQSVSADLLQYSFIGPKGERKVVSPAEKYVSTKQAIDFTLSSGLDRKVRISIVDLSDNVISSQVSSLVGVDDRFSVNGSEYYGKKLSLPAPPEGDYKIVAETLNSVGDSTQKDSYELIIDTTPPVATGSAPDRTGNNWPLDVLTNYGYAEKTLLYTGFHDEKTEVVSAEYFTIDPEGVRRTMPVSMDASSQTVTILLNDATSEAVAPYDRTKYVIGFAFTDRAGNVGDFRMNSSVDRTVPPIYTQVFNPKTAVWEDYTSGMTIYENPVQMRYVRRKSDVAAFNGTRFGWGSIDAWGSEDSVNVYNPFKMAYPQLTTYNVYRTVAGKARNMHQNQYTFTMGPGVAAGPNPTQLIYHIKGKGWVNSRNWNASTPEEVDQLEFFAEARPYIQKATAGPATCDIPAGQTSCVAVTSIKRTSGRGYTPYSYSVRSASGLVAHNSYFYTYWDLNEPVVTDAWFEPTDKKVFVKVFDADRMNNWQISMWDTRKFELVAKRGGETIQVPLIKAEELDYQTKLATFDVGSLPTGDYEFMASATDTYGNTGTKTFNYAGAVDNTGPEITIHAAEEVMSLDQIIIAIKDDHDPLPQIDSITLKGGPESEDVNLAWRQAGKVGEFNLEYPLMFPTRAPGEEFDLEVTAIDEQNNRSTVTKTFAYKPRITIVNGETGVFLPAIERAITGEGLPAIYSEPVAFEDGTLVVGEYDLVATLRSDADYPVNIWGYQVNPGETVVIDNYNFNDNGSRVKLPLYAVGNKVGKANLLIFPGAPGAQYILADIQTWKPNPVVEVNGKPFDAELTVEQALERVKITVTGGQGDPCTYTSDESEILAANPLLSPHCTIEWDLPDTVKWNPESYTAAGYLAGIEEDAVVGYKLYLPQNGNLKAVEIASSSAEIDIVTPDISFAFDPDGAVTRHITEFMKVVVNKGSTSCQPTVNPADARLGTKYGYPKCLIEWNLTPPGAATSIYTPMVQGIAQDEGSMDFTFDVTYFDPDENPYILAEQSLAIEVLPPKPVELILPESGYGVDKRGYPKFFMGLDGEYIDPVRLTASGADIDINMSLDGRIVREIPYAHRGGRERDTDYAFRLWVEDLELWGTQTVELTGAYRLMPEINDAVQATVIGVPSTQMRAKLEIDGRKLLDTEDVEVKVLMEGRAVVHGYKPEEHGVWDVQIRYEESSGETKNLTDWEPVSGDGTLTKTLKLGDLSNGYMYGVLRLRSPFEEYSREMRSNRNFINVLRGGAVEGEITATRVAGPSVFTAFLRVRAEDRQYEYSLGDVEWLVSKDNGSNYEPVEDGARGTYMRGDFSAGRYWIKARLHNKYTGAVAETGVQEIHVYDVPEVKIEGPQNTFKSQPAELRATTTLDREPVPVENYHVEWSDDGGETWEPRLTKIAEYDGENDRMRYRVRVRDNDAPLDAGGIYRERSHRLNFIDPEGPRTRIYGPRRLERGDPGDYRVDLSPPRSGMEVEMEGEWHLPDGSVIPGSDPIVYNPSEDDVHEGRVTIMYRSWVKGFRDQGAESDRDHRISAWQYVWPNWDVFANTGVLEAPAEIRLTPRTPGWFGWLDDEQYEWTFPAGTELVYDNEKRPTIRIEEPGEHRIKLLVSDARGNETEVVKILDLQEPSETEIEFGYYTGNKFMRAPLSVRPRIYMRGGHRLDRIQDREILVNGKTLVKGSRIHEFVLEKPGTYDVTARLYSKMGRVVETTEEITVVPNKAPVCEPAANDRFGYLMIEANCSDEDGRIAEIVWEMGGERLPSSSYKYRFTESQLKDMGGSVQIQVSAKDDAGALSKKHTVTYTAP